jgi:hypothetical protein
MATGTGTMTLRMLAAGVLLVADAYAAPTALQQEASMSDRTPLAQLVEPINAEVARMIRDPKTTVRRLNTPFLLDGLIFQVDWHGPYKPVSLTIGYARHENFTVLLPINMAGFQELVARAGMTLDTDEQRIAFAVTALETTRRFDETFLVLRSFDDLRLMANPTAPDEKRFRAIRQEYEPLIRLPRTGGNGPWVMPIYVLSGGDLCLFTVTLDAAGNSAIAKTVLEADTPILPAG